MKGSALAWLVLLHDDGTTGEYFHLERGSALVRPGDRVECGQQLARSGNTGFSAVAHLHFGVYRTERDGRTESLAVRFAARGGVVLRSGARYLNSAR
jgi:murein DD-endopeptidase MepM/ murein hydrolase activator NlpD